MATKDRQVDRQKKEIGDDTNIHSSNCLFVSILVTQQLDRKCSSLCLLFTGCREISLKLKAL